MWLAAEVKTLVMQKLHKASMVTAILQLMINPACPKTYTYTYIYICITVHIYIYAIVLRVSVDKVMQDFYHQQ